MNRGKMYKVNFQFYLTDTDLVNVEASCSDVGLYDCSDLVIRFLDNEGNAIQSIPYDEEMFDDIELEAMERLADEKYSPQLEIG